MNNYIFILTTLLFTANQLFSQNEPVLRSGTPQVMEEALKDSEKRLVLAQLEAFTQEFIANNQPRSVESNYIIPLVVHVIHNYDNENIDLIILNGKKLEDNTNQILEFTKEVKNMDQPDKIKIIETLWSIIYSNKDADIYETNLMRRLAGLLYIDSKIMGDIKERIKKENS